LSRNADECKPLVKGAIMGVTPSTGGEAAAPAMGPVMAVWRVEADAETARNAPPPAAMELHTPVDASSEDSMLAALATMSADAASDMVPTLQGRASQKLPPTSSTRILNPGV
jgi:hypothetical protein